MDKYFLDTSVVVSYMRGKEDVINTLERVDTLFYTNFVVVAELSEGIYRVKDSEEMEKAVDNFVGGMDGVIDLDMATARKFGEIRADLKRKGNVLEDFDILIAANCLVNKLPIITLNPAHFKRIRNLEVLTPGDFKN